MASFRTTIAILVSAAALVATTACEPTKKPQTATPSKRASVSLPVPNKKMSNMKCATRAEMKGINARSLQTELMVGALTCKQNTKYAAAVGKFKGTMRSSSDAMKGYFNRNYGKSASTQTDQFVTRLANESATRSKHLNPSQYCNAVEDTFDTVLAMSENQYAEYAEDPTFSNATGISECAKSGR